MKGNYLLFTSDDSVKILAEYVLILVISIGGVFNKKGTKSCIFVVVHILTISAMLHF